MNLFKEIIITAPVNNRLKFGHQANIRVMKIDTNVRTNKGLPIKQNTFITLSQFDLTTNKVIAQSEGSYWNLDHTSDFVVSNFIDQFTSLASMIDALGKNVDDFQDDVVSVLPDDIDVVDTYLTTKDGAAALQKSLIDNAAKYLADVVGDKSPLLKAKVITNKKGFFELGREINWVLPMDSEEELALLTAGDRKAWRESMKADDETPKESDKVGEKPAASGNVFDGL